MSVLTKEQEACVRPHFEEYCRSVADKWCYLERYPDDSECRAGEYLTGYIEDRWRSYAAAVAMYLPLPPTTSMILAGKLYLASFPDVNAADQGAMLRGLFLAMYMEMRQPGFWNIDAKAHFGIG